MLFIVDFLVRCWFSECCVIFSMVVILVCLVGLSFLIWVRLVMFVCSRLC